MAAAVESGSIDAVGNDERPISTTAVMLTSPSRISRMAADLLIKLLKLDATRPSEP